MICAARPKQLGKGYDMQTLVKVTLTLICAGLLSGCEWLSRPAVSERPVLDALAPQVNTLARCVTARDWPCTTVATRVIVATMDAGQS